MDNVIISDAAGKEIREAIFTEYDFEVGNGENSYQLTIKRSEWEKIPKYGRIYIPGTEYGGLYRRLDSTTQQGTACPGGLTWRGMLQKKIIQPPSGQNYASDSGELNTIIRNRIAEAFPAWTGSDGTYYPSPIIGSSEDSGRRTAYRFDYARYCTLHDGLQSLLAVYGYRMEIKYDQIQRAAVVSAVPIVDYSEDEEFSSDMQMNYIIQQNQDAVNHLICLGEGELANRTVLHLYRVADRIYTGEITGSFLPTSFRDIQEVYDYAGASLKDLRAAGVNRLSEIKTETYSIEMSGSLDIEIGDIIGGRDYITGYYLSAPVTNKIVRWQNGFRTYEYSISENVEVVKGGGYFPDEQEGEPAEPVTLAAAPSLSKLALETEPIESLQSTATTPPSNYIADELVGAVAEPAEEVNE